jgi:glycosyltransferase involved in cell wall biosynthesis
MAVLLLSDIHVAYVSTPAWQRRLSRYAPRKRRFVWTPVPCTIQHGSHPTIVAAWRDRLRGGTPTGARLVAHFGTYGTLVVQELASTLELLLRGDDTVRVVLIGPGGERFAERLCAVRAEWRERIVATGRLAGEDAAACLSACDVAVQPYADGASGRRTSLMAALANHVAVATTRGAATEPDWDAAGAVAFAPSRRRGALAGTVLRLLGDDGERQRVALAGAALYEERFALRHTIRALCNETGGGR